MADLGPGRVHRVPSMVPGKRQFGLISLVVEPQIVFDFFVRLPWILVKPFVTGAIRRRVMCVSVARFHEGLLLVVFPPVFFFLSCWIHSFCHSMCTTRRSDAADHCPNCRACRSAEGGAPPAAPTLVPTGCAPGSPVIGSVFFLGFSLIPSVAPCCIALH
jgi:hypothetical protein